MFISIWKRFHFQKVTIGFGLEMSGTDIWRPPQQWTQIRWHLSVIAGNSSAIEESESESVSIPISSHGFPLFLSRF